MGIMITPNPRGYCVEPMRDCPQKAWHAVGTEEAGVLLLAFYFLPSASSSPQADGAREGEVRCCPSPRRKGRAKVWLRFLGSTLWPLDTCTWGTLRLRFFWLEWQQLGGGRPETGLGTCWSCLLAAQMHEFCDPGSWGSSFPPFSAAGCPEPPEALGLRCGREG